MGISVTVESDINLTVKMKVHMEEYKDSIKVTHSYVVGVEVYGMCLNGRKGTSYG